MAEIKKHKVLFFSYWYPNKINRIFPVFTRKHAQAIAMHSEVKVLSLSIIKSQSIYKCYSEVIHDEKEIETHQVYIESVFFKLLYMMLPVHYYVLKKYWKKHFETESFDIIHSNILFPCAIVGHWLAQNFRKKHVITEHWSKLDSFFKSNLYRGSARKAYNTANAITCVSDVLRQMLQKHTNNHSVYIVPNVIDSTEFYYEPDKNKTFTFVAAANWTEPKNPQYFLKALETLKQENKLGDFELCFIGNGHQLEATKTQKYSFKIIYPGVINSKQLKQELNKSHIFLHGSDFETFSTIIVEALLCGLPAVVSNVGIASEVINPSNGFVTNNTAADWVDKILLCYNTQYDGYTISEQLKGRYDSESVGKMFGEIYNGIENY